jgi:hypothetical protein
LDEQTHYIVQESCGSESAEEALNKESQGGFFRGLLAWACKPARTGLHADAARRLGEFFPRPTDERFCTDLLPVIRACKR